MDEPDEQGESEMDTSVEAGPVEVLSAALGRKDWSLGAEQRVFREQLGLATDRPIVMSGHQATFWHPGILAKYMAMVSAAERYGAQAVWLVVDQDVNDALGVRYPVLVSGKDGERLEARTWRAGEAGSRSAEEDWPTGRRGVVKAAALPADVGMAAAPGVGAGLEAIRAALDASQAEGAESLAGQVAGAVLALAAGAVRGGGGGWERGSAVRVVMASDVARTDAMVRLVNLMAHDPERVRKTYNDAVGMAGAAAGVRALSAGELPVWRIGRSLGSPRRGGRDADSWDPAAVMGGEIVPRALLLTGMMRLHGCEAFIHGTGGAGNDGQSGYDALTSMWMLAWLGQRLAPMAMVTATVRLRMRLGHEPRSADEARRIIEWARKAKHFPKLLMMEESAIERSRLVERLNALRRRRDAEGHAERKRLYRELHAVIAEARAFGKDTLEHWRQEAARAKRELAEAEIVEDRTWAFPLYQPDQLAGLWEEFSGR